MLQHRLATVWRHDPKRRFGNIGHIVLVAAHHRAGMERCDLVVIKIGGDEGLCCIQIIDLLDVIHVHAASTEMLAVRSEILAYRCHRQRIGTEQFEVVGDIAGAAAKFATHPRHQERDVQDMHLVRQDVVLELVRKHHDGVVSE